MVIKTIITLAFKAKYYNKLIEATNIDIVDMLYTLFDSKWYIKTYLSNNLSSNRIAFLHYLFIGLPKNYNPNPLFALNHYSEIKLQNRIRSLASPLILDFLLRSNSKFIDPSPSFSGSKYLEIHHDVALSGQNPFMHYYLNGINEKRSISKSTQLDVEPEIVLNEKVKLKACLIIQIDAFDSFQQFDQILLAQFNKTFVVTKNKFDISSFNTQSNIEFLENTDNVVYQQLSEKISNYDLACKIDLDNQQISESNTANTIGNSIKKIDRLTLLTKIKETKNKFSQYPNLGILGSWSFYYNSLNFRSTAIDSFLSICKDDEKEKDWTFFASGSYWFRPSILKYALNEYQKAAIDRSIRYTTLDKKAEFRIQMMDLLIGKLSAEMGCQHMIKYGKDIHFNSFGFKLLNSVEQPKFALDQPFINTLSEINIEYDSKLIKANEAIDQDHYLEENPTSFNMDTALHYLRYGTFLKMNPSEGFDSKMYASIYHLNSSNINPLIHYLNVGKSINNNIFPTQLNLDKAIELIKASGLFDKDHYLNHVEFQNSKPNNPIKHYCEFGWKLGLSPTKQFDVFDYEIKNFQFANLKYNPLLHFIIRDGNIENFSHSIKKRPLAIQNSIHYRPKRICLFAGYDKYGIVDEYVLDYLEELSRHADVYYLADCLMEKEQLQKLKKFTKGAWAIKHGEYDFGSYHRLATTLVGWDKIDQYDELLFVNDSCFLLNPLDKVFQKMDSELCDWWGLEATKGMYKNRDRSKDEITDPIPITEVKKSYVDTYLKQNNYDFFIGSYFLVFRKPVINDAKFRSYVNNISKQNSKELLIIKYEIGISRMLIKAGFEFSTFISDLYPFHPLFSNSHFVLIKKGFPLFKRYLLTRNHYKVPGLQDWRERLTPFTSTCSISKIENNIFRTANYAHYFKSINIHPEHVLLNNKQFVHLDKLMDKKSNWWVFPVCAYDHGLNGNLRAVFESVKNNAAIKKIVLVRSKHLSFEGKNIVVVPLFSRKGQELILQSEVVFFKHTRFRNIRYNITGSNRRLINLWHGIPLKKIGTESIDQQHNLEALMKDNSLLTSLIASSEIDKKNMHRSFKPLEEDQVWVTGLPRNDFILEEESTLPSDMIQETDLLNQITNGKKLILFVPTFRNSQDYFKFSLADKIRLHQILKSANAVLGIRHHFASKHKGYFNQFKKFGAIELSSKQFKNIEVLYRKTEILLTDYSSCYIDFLLTNKPVISFAYDLETYATEERGLFFDMKDVFPGEICMDASSLIDAIEKNLNKNRSEEELIKYQSVKKMFHKFEDGKNTKRIVEKLLV